jgi:hypothetical protein
LQRKKQALKMSRASETRALTAGRKVAVLVWPHGCNSVGRAQERDGKGDGRNGNEDFIRQPRLECRWGLIVGWGVGWRSSWSGRSALVGSLNRRPLP